MKSAFNKTNPYEIRLLRKIISLLQTAMDGLDRPVSVQLAGP